MPMDRRTIPGDIVVVDGLPLERLYARFDAMARGRAAGDSAAAHRSVIERLQANQRRAEVLGWTAFVLERAGGTGRLALRRRPPGHRISELVPDVRPYDGPPQPTVRGRRVDVSHAEGRIGSDRINLSWQSRMRWLDDVGR